MIHFVVGKQTYNSSKASNNYFSHFIFYIFSGGQVPL